MKIICLYINTNNYFYNNNEQSRLIEILWIDKDTLIQ